jgi:hypothetical protein
MGIAEISHWIEFGHRLFLNSPKPFYKVTIFTGLSTNGAKYAVRTTLKSPTRRGTPIYFAGFVYQQSDTLTSPGGWPDT